MRKRPSDCGGRGRANGRQKSKVRSLWRAAPSTVILGVGGNRGAGGGLFRPKGASVNSQERQPLVQTPPASVSYRLSGKESTGRCAMLSTAASRNPIITEFREAAVESMPPNLVHYFSEDR